MALPSGITKITNIKGAKGDKGDKGNTGTIDYATAESVPAEQPASVAMIGNEANRGAHFQIPRGLPGVNAVPADEAVASYVATQGTLTRAAVGASTVGVQKKVQGGNYPTPLRVPTLLTRAIFPNRRTEGIRNILWAENEGRTLYGYATDASLYKSLDGGNAWTHIAYLSWAPALQGAFLKTGAGTLLTIDNQSTPKKIRRSTDDGVTWTVVGELRAGWTPLGTQSWDIDPTTGTIYLGEYGDGLECRLWKSTDDGATWTVHHDFPARDSTDPDKIRHIHAIQWDPFSESMWICVGDSLPTTGFWKVTASGVEEVLTNRMLPAGNWDQGGFFDAPRAIGIMPFPDYVAWASDSTTNPGVFRVARTELGSPAPVVERLYRTNSTNWFTCKASDDGSRWVFSSSQEARDVFAIDHHVHLYAVEDQGATVYEVAAIEQRDKSISAGSLRPVGTAGIHGNIFLLSARNTGNSGTWMLAFAEAATATLTSPPRPPVVAGWKTITTGGPITVPAAGAVRLASDRVPSFGRLLRIFDAGVASTDGSAGRIGVRVVDRTSGTVLFSSTSFAVRAVTHKEWAPFVAEVPLTGQQIVDIEAYNTHGVLSVEGVAQITYGFGQ